MLSDDAPQLNVKDDCMTTEALRFVGGAGGSVSGTEAVVTFIVVLFADVFPEASFAFI